MVQERRSRNEGLRPTELSAVPHAWGTAQLDSVAANEEASFVDGPFGSNLKADEFVKNGFARVVQLQNIDVGRFVDTNEKYITENKFHSLERHSAYPGDLAIAKMAEPVARACILPNIEDRYIVVADCIKLDVRDGLNSAYVMYALNSHDVWTQAYARSRGSTRKRINLSQLKEVQIPSPPLKEQRKIASVLYTVDELIRRTESVIKTAEDLKSGLANELFTSGVGGSEVEEGRWQNAADHKPVNWDVYKASDLIDITRGASPRPKGDPELFGGNIPWIKISDVDRSGGQMVTSTVDTVTEKGSRKSKVVGEGTLLVANSGTVGFAIFAGMRACVHDGWLILRNYADSLNKKFLYHFINWNQNFLKSLAPGSTQTNLNTERFGIMDLFVPPKDEQERIAGILDELDEVRLRNREYWQALVRLRKGLMQDLLSGEVRTKDVEIETPEEVVAYG